MSLFDLLAVPLKRVLDYRKAEKELQVAYAAREILDVTVMLQNGCSVSGPYLSERYYFNTKQIPMEVSGLAGARVAELNPEILISPEGLGESLYRRAMRRNGGSVADIDAHQIVWAIRNVAKQEGGARLVQVARTPFSKMEYYKVANANMRCNRDVATFSSNVQCGRGLEGDKYAFWFVTPHTCAEMQVLIEKAQARSAEQQASGKRGCALKQIPSAGGKGQLKIA